MASRAYNSARRELASIQTRDAILAAAVELFGANGYPRTTIAEIARRAGVATNTVYLDRTHPTALVLPVIYPDDVK